MEWVIVAGDVDDDDVDDDDSTCARIELTYGAAENPDERNTRGTSEGIRRDASDADEVVVVVVVSPPPPPVLKYGAGADARAAGAADIMVGSRGRTSFGEIRKPSLR